MELFAQNDWDGIPVPAEANNPKVSWELVRELSDDFNYESISPQEMGEAFQSKWKDGFINNWTGPENTYWTPDASLVKNGNLEITASRRSGTQVNFQAVSSKTKIIYPAYIETRMKIMNSVMANAVWMLNDGSTEEIDIVEAYGAGFANSNQTSRDWFAKRMHLSHHTFVRNPFQDYQPTDAGSWYSDGTYWRDKYRVVGVYWRDPFHLEYYIDGKLVRTVSGSNMIDPHEYLGGKGLSDEESLIISGASQGWQVTAGVWPTDEELAKLEDNIFKVDWIRVYKRIGGDKYIQTSVSPVDQTDKIFYSNPVGRFVTIHAGAKIKKIDFYNMSGILMKSHLNNSLSDIRIPTGDLPDGMYLLQAIDLDGTRSVIKICKNQ